MTSTKKVLIAFFTILPVIFLIWYGFTIFRLFNQFDSPAGNLEPEMPSMMVRMILPMALMAINSLAMLVFYIVDIFNWNPNFKGEKNNNQIIWTLVVLLTGIIGMLVYFFVEIYPRKIEADSTHELLS